MKIAWSYSSLQQFNTCPRQYYHLRVLKDVKDKPGEAARWGQEAHKHLENYIKGTNALPQKLSRLQKVVDRIVSQPHDTIEAEKQYCFDSSFKPVAWFSKSAWCRAVIDVEIKDGDKATLLDWKFGKRKPDSTQLKLFAAVAMTADKNINVVDTGFVWIPDKKTDRATFTRDDVPMIWQEFVGQVSRIEAAAKEDRWPPRPSGLCKNHCPVGKDKCDFCGE